MCHLSDCGNDKSVEQGFQHIKAKHNKDEVRAGLIMKAKEPSLAKHYGDKVVVSQKWLEEVREDVLEKLNVVKYAEESLAVKLCDTHPHPLVEGTKDLHWAGGSTFDHENYDNGVVVGNNTFGKILERVRHRRIVERRAAGAGAPVAPPDPERENQEPGGAPDEEDGGETQTKTKEDLQVVVNEIQQEVAGEEQKED